ncbi:hypothetical protein D3C86_2045770 [compost metagenome]
MGLDEGRHHHHVRVDVAHIFAAGLADARVARPGPALVGLGHAAQARVVGRQGLDELGGGVGGAVVHHQDLVGKFGALIEKRAERFL